MSGEVERFLPVDTHRTCCARLPDDEGSEFCGERAEFIETDEIDGCPYPLVFCGPHVVEAQALNEALDDEVWDDDDDDGTPIERNNQ